MAGSNKACMPLEDGMEKDVLENQAVDKFRRPGSPLGKIMGLL